MTFAGTPLVKAAITAAIIGLAATCATAAQFKVNLPEQTQWGRTLLSPGQYTVSVDRGSPEMHIFGNGKNVSVLVAVTSELAEGSPSLLSMVDVNGTPVVRELTLGNMGKRYTFLTPSAKQVSSAARRTMAFTLRDKPAAH